MYDMKNIGQHQECQPALTTVFAILFTVGLIFAIGAGIKLLGMAVYASDLTYPGEIALLPWSAFWPAGLILLAWTKPLEKF
jgi:hypothetical protein